MFLWPKTGVVPFAYHDTNLVGVTISRVISDVAVINELLFELRQVSFSYRGDSRVLHDINLVIEPGQTVALVGPTGAGKSFIANLMARFYDVSEGEVLIDGLDVRQVRQHSLRRQVGLVPQDSFLFSGTIVADIRFGRFAATVEELEAAARQANAHDFINALPKVIKRDFGRRG